MISMILLIEIPVRILVFCGLKPPPSTTSLPKLSIKFPPSTGLSIKFPPSIEVS